MKSLMSLHQRQADIKREIQTGPDPIYRKVLNAEYQAIEKEIQEWGQVTGQRYRIT